MLQNIRDRFTSPIVWGVLALLLVPFAFTGVDFLSFGQPERDVAKVGDRKITEGEVQNAYDAQMRRLQEMLGENFKSDMIQPERFRKDVTEQLVQEALMAEHAQDAGYRASDLAVLKALQSDPGFQKDGKFDQATYEATLKRYNYTPTTYEDNLRARLSNGQVQSVVLGTAFATPQEVAASWRLANQLRAFSYATLSLDAAKSSVTVTDAELAEYFKANGAKYQSPERMTVQYIELALSSLAPVAAPGPDVLKPLYQASIANFSSPESRRASHILVSTGADKSAALKKAQELKARLDKGEDFASLAKSVSEDPGSKDQGGDLGEVRKGQMTPKFEEALFALKMAGEVSAPVETEYGYHLIKLKALVPAAVKPFEDPSVQAELIEAFRRKDAETRFADLSTKLETQAFENNGPLEGIAKGLGLTVQTSAPFNRSSGTGAAAVDAFRTAAFGEDVMNGDNSKLVSLGDNRVAVLRKLDYQAARPQKLEEVKDLVASALKAERASKQLQDKADALMAAARKPGADFAAAAAAAGVNVSSPGAVKRDDSNVDPALLQETFKLPRPAANAMSLAKAKLASGDVAVVALASVVDAKLDTAAPEFVAASARLKDSLGGAEYAGFRKLLESKVGVTRKAAAAPATE